MLVSLFLASTLFAQSAAASDAPVAVTRAPLASVVPSNLGLAVDELLSPFPPLPDPLMAFGGRHLAFHVLEANQGVDLNADGDLTDRILHLYDHRTARIRNLGKEAASKLAFFGGNLVYCVSEADEGIDSNGDGDLVDFVLHASSLSNGRTTSLGLATVVASWEKIHGASDDALFFSVSESGQGGLDRNLDGDAFDYVLHRFGPARALFVGSAGVRAPVVQQDDVYARLAGSGPLVEVSPRGAAFLVWESDQGRTDLNGDGDKTDAVLAFHDTVRGRVVLSGMQGQPAFPVAGARTVFRVAEKQQGNLDLNGDGDTDDEVAHLFDADTGAVLSYGIAARSSTWIGERVVTIVHEFSEGGQDLNGDGDAVDHVAFYGRYDDPSPASTGLAVLAVGGVGDRIFLSVNEVAQGMQDLNGDGDTGDLVLFSLDPTTGAATNLGLTMGGLPGPSERLVPLLVDELFASLDYNLDGDQADIVLGVYDHLNGSITNTGFAVFPAGLGTGGLRLEVVGTRIAFPAPEGGNGVDYNTDGDLNDVVPFVYDADTGSFVNASLPGDFRLGESFLALLADEEMQGEQDLNGDGDTGDQVLHILPLE